MRYIGAVALICGGLLFVLSGCKSSEKVGTVASKGAKAHAAFFDAMQEKAFQFETLNARMNAEILLSGQPMHSRVDMKMIKDSILSLSVLPALGIEIFRVVIDRDSVKIIDRMNRRYLAESHTRMKEQTPISFNYNNLQSLFINHLFFPGEEQVTSALYPRFLLNQAGSAAEIQARDKSGLTYTFQADGEEKLLSTSIADSSESYALQWLYSDFRIIESQPFPMRMDVNLFQKGKSKGGITLGFSRVETNTPVTIEANIPTKYKRVTFTEIKKIFQSANE